jgi:hypothetical protein
LGSAFSGRKHKYFDMSWQGPLVVPNSSGGMTEIRG